MRPIGLQLYTLRKPFAADPLGTLEALGDSNWAFYRQAFGHFVP